MSRQLAVRELEIDQFGGISGRSIRIPEHPFVVIAGPNEAGKTTLATVVSWLLAGPGGDAQRFGDVNTRLIALLRGSFGGEVFTCDGTFRVPADGTPDESNLKISYRGTVTASGWRAAIGGIDPDVVRAIYRLWGADLHDGTVVDAELSRVALGSFAGRIDARNLALQLSETAQNLFTLGDQGSPSVQELQNERDFLRRSLEEARRTTLDYASIQRAIEQVHVQRDLLVENTAGQESERSLLERAIGAIGFHLEVIQRRTDLKALPPVPDEWVNAVAQHDILSELLRQRDDHGRDVERAEDEVRRIGSAIEIRPDVLSAVAVTDAHQAELTRLVGTLSTADETRATALLLTMRTTQDLADATARSDAAIAGIADPGGQAVTREQVLRTRVDAEAQTALLEASAAWRQAQVNAETIRPRAEAAQVELQAVMSGKVRSPLPLILSFAGIAAGVIAAGGAYIGERLVVMLAGGVGVLSFLAAGVSTMALRRDRGLNFESHLATAQRELATTSESLRLAELSTLRAQQEVQRLCSEFGYRPIGHPAAVGAVLQSYGTVAQLLAAERAAEQAAHHSRAELEGAERMIGELESSIRTVMLGCGIPETVPVRSADRLAADIQTLHQARRTVSEAETELAAINERISGLLGPVAPTVAGWPTGRIRDQLDDVARRIEARGRAMEELARAERALAAALEDRADVEEVLASGAEKAHLERRLAEVEESLRGATLELQSLSEQSGELAEKLRELEQRETLADLVAMDGTLADQQHRLVVETIASGFASTMLRGVVEAYVREHQPALVERTSELVRLIAPAWSGVEAHVNEGHGPSMALAVRSHDGRVLPSMRLSTGARALLYLALRVAMADHDGDLRQVQFPLLCDDPLVHMDDTRAVAAVKVLADAATRRQVLLFTCHERTVEAATAVGARLVTL